MKNVRSKSPDRRFTCPRCEDTGLVQWIADGVGAMLLRIPRDHAHDYCDCDSGANRRAERAEEELAEARRIAKQTSSERWMESAIERRERYEEEIEDLEDMLEKKDELLREITNAIEAEEKRLLGKR